MKWYWSILLTITIVSVVVAFSAFTNGDAFWLMLLIVAVSAVWGAVDSAKIGFWKYKSRIAHGPIGVGIFILLLWVIAFPWYLTVRYKITTGRYPEHPHHIAWTGMSETDRNAVDRWYMNVPKANQTSASVLWELFRILKLVGGIGIIFGALSLLSDLDDSGIGKAFGKVEWPTVITFSVFVPIFFAGLIGARWTR